MQSTLRPLDVECIPERLEEGVLYICERYRTAVHKCCCGCGGEVVTPLTPADWSIHRVDGTVTLRPSIGNWSFACRSHYHIRRNKVMWANAMSPREIRLVRKRDQADKDAYADAQNHWKGAMGSDGADTSRPRGAGQTGLSLLWQILLRLWKG
jgi:hypothetical protein